MPTAYLHIGAHKTGTSAFQTFMVGNREWLEAHGVFVPKAGQAPLGAHHILARAIADRSAPRSFQRIAHDFEAEAEASGGRDLLISTEGFAKRIGSTESLNHVVEYFEHLGYSVAVIYYLRSMAPFFNSAYAQMAKTLNQPLMFEDALTGWIDDKEAFSRLPPFMSDKRVRKIVRPYTKSVREQGIVVSLLGEIGLPQPPAIERGSVNTSPGPLTIYLGRWLTRSINEERARLTPRQRWACIDAVNDVVKSAGPEADSYVGLTADTARRIETTLSAWCEDFALAGWGKSWVETFSDELGLSYHCNDIEIADTFRPSESRLEAMRKELLERWAQIKLDPMLAQTGPPARRLAA